MSQSETPSNRSLSFDAVAKEQALRAESEAWDTSQPVPAQPGEIPVMDLAAYLAEPSEKNLHQAAEVLGEASRRIGFYTLTGHGISASLLEAGFEQIKRFFVLPEEDKRALQMDTPNIPIPGTGYLPVKHRKLPRRDSGNENEALIIKSASDIPLSANPWPPATVLPEFRATIQRLAEAFATLATALLPVYARALNLPHNFFKQAFEQPLYRLRMTHYPPFEPDQDSLEKSERFGIAPHVDTTFFTLLAQQSAGLYVHNAESNRWLSMPHLEQALVVNNGEILKLWSNDEFVSTKHFANNLGNNSRYAIPFFYNPHPHAELSCLPSCQGPDRPPKYPTFTYATSQGTVQGE